MNFEEEEKKCVQNLGWEGDLIKNSERDERIVLRWVLLK
jgi:hypothetical protein